MSTSTNFCRFESPFGPLTLVSNGTELTQLLLPPQPLKQQPGFSGRADDVLKQACEELQGWFRGDRTEFDVPWRAAGGTTFQHSVWRELGRIPFGSTMTYAQLAAQLRRPSAARAVGAASGRNPLPIILPCHRVIGANGSLTGYAGGLPLKQWLLDHEQSVCRSGLRVASTGRLA